MLLLFFSTQILLPLCLLAWLAFAPAAGWLAWGLQLLAVAAVLLGMSTAMLWAMPPYWTPYLYWMLFFFIVTWQLLAGLPDTGQWWAAGTIHSLFLLALFGLGSVAAYLAYGALAGRQVPEIAVVDIDFPFPAGRYLVAHGGSTVTVNGHLQTLNPGVERYQNYRGQSRALDIFRISRTGFNVRGLRPREPERYTSFGTALVAPCPGHVAKVVDGVPDNPVPEMNREHMAGNFVAINCGEFYLIMAHFRQGSIQVEEGQTVATGDFLGELGNSGNSSEPHLHIHAQRGLPEEAPLSGEPLALTINGRFPVRNQRITVPE
ncbi:MAG: M23 family metallopeptidase [Pseudomonadales bacterium]|nr:M23 family metallopeptidase [Pseudomonadales bacterium]